MEGKYGAASPDFPGPELTATEGGDGGSEHSGFDLHFSDNE